MKFPLIRRKIHDGIINKLKKQAIEERNCYQRQMKAQEAEIREKIEPMMKKFIKVGIRYSHSDFKKYRLLIEMDTCWVEKCLIHGNSQKEINYICEIIGRQVCYELEPILRSRNFERVG